MLSPIAIHRIIDDNHITSHHIRKQPSDDWMICHNLPNDHFDTMCIFRQIVYLFIYFYFHFITNKWNLAHECTFCGCINRALPWSALNAKHSMR